MFEHRSERVVPRDVFVRRQLGCVLASGFLVTVSLAAGAAGYHSIEQLTWIDSLHSAAMILTGMGPVSEMKTSAGKLFESGYAIFSGVVFLSVVTMTLAPAAHRMLHKLHVEE